MEFRPCIDIHNGSVKQIVGSSLCDEDNKAKENFVAKKTAADFAKLYKEYGIKNGHIILLNSPSSSYFEKTREQAIQALAAYPGGLQIGGSVNPENAKDYLNAGASHVIVTSYVFQNGQIRYDRLQELKKCVGKDKLVLDLSAGKKGEQYYIVTDRWQKYTDVMLSRQTLDELSAYCDEFLVHAIDVEGKASGIERPVAKLLGDWGKIPVTYAGGVHSFEDLEELKVLGKARIHVTIGSALDLFGGNMKFEDVIAFCLH